MSAPKSPSTPSHPKIFNNPTTTKQSHIEYVPIIEEKIEYRICKDIQSVNTINRPSLDIDILNEEPSTSGLLMLQIIVIETVIVIHFCR